MEMSEVTERLQAARAIAWAELVPAFDYALVLAEEAEHLADQRSNEWASNVPVAYPPLVKRLADSA